MKGSQFTYKVVVRIQSDLTCSLQQISDCLVDGSYWYCFGEDGIHLCEQLGVKKSQKNAHVPFHSF